MELNKISPKEILEQTKALLSHALTSEDLMKKMVSVLRYHEWRYYVKNDPIIADAEYDQLFHKLKSWEDEHPLWIVENSPTTRVGSDLSGAFKTVEHQAPMLSLGNAYNGDDLHAFDKQMRKRMNLEEGVDIEYIVEPKFDGGTAVLLYENDLLVRAATRGNGAAGDDITHNIKTLPSVPLHAALSKKGITQAEVRGEAIIKKSVFEEINKTRESKDETLFANPRNTATGGLRTKSSKEASGRGIEVFVYQISYVETKTGMTVEDVFLRHDESINFLGSLGFKIPENISKTCKNIEEVIAFCDYWQEHRDTYAYEIDGMVVKLNDLKEQIKMGSTAHHPRWAIAYKFKAKQATTKLIDVTYQVGKIGTITPVAKVEPTSLAGVTISSISLHNADFIESKDLYLGDHVLIERAGDVIPYIVKSFPEMRTGNESKITFPKYCPINPNEENQVLLLRDQDEAAWRCPNCVCGAQDLQRIIFFVSKVAMDIDGLGKSLVERFYELGWIQDIADVFNLDYDQVSQLEGLGEKSARNIQLAIDQSKGKPLYRLLSALGIHHLGKKAASLIANEVKDVFELATWDKEKFLEIDGIGPVVAENVMAYFQEEENMELVRKLADFGVNVSRLEDDIIRQASTDDPLFGKTILFTGSLQKMTRKEAQSMATKAGAKNISAVSKNLNILVVGEKAGSKLKKAESLGTVEIITEETFLKIIESKSE